MTNTEITLNGRTYRILGIHEVFEMYIVQEVGRLFRTLIDFDEVWS